MLMERREVDEDSKGELNRQCGGLDGKKIETNPPWKANLKNTVQGPRKITKISGGNHGRRSTDLGVFRLFWGGKVLVIMRGEGLKVEEEMGSKRNPERFLPMSWKHQRASKGTHIIEGIGRQWLRVETMRIQF